MIIFAPTSLRINLIYFLQHITQHKSQIVNLSQFVPKTPLVYHILSHRLLPPTSLLELLNIPLGILLSLKLYLPNIIFKLFQQFITILNLLPIIINIIIFPNPLIRRSSIPNKIKMIHNKNKQCKSHNCTHHNQKEKYCIRHK